LLAVVLLFSGWQHVGAQVEQHDSIVASLDSAFVSMMDSINAQALDSAQVLSDGEGMLTADTIVVAKAKKQRDWSTWRPNPQRALWLALVFPGGGQIYNRKYWKLPIVYGGFVGCIYALRWNNTMYKDYAQAYLDIMDDDPGTASYNKFLHLGRTIDSTNEDRYKQIFKSRKDRFRRWRDLSFFCMVAVYAISVIDAYVDAELSEFDISKDLSLKVEPTVFTRSKNNNAFSNPAVGLQCSLKF